MGQLVKKQSWVEEIGTESGYVEELLQINFQIDNRRKSEGSCVSLFSRDFTLLDGANPVLSVLKARIVNAKKLL